jgi:cellulose synthase/poly-beta-1,6-N-acetylglucosamine synthase-like glycosyltransferase
MKHSSLNPVDTTADDAASAGSASLPAPDSPAASPNEIRTVGPPSRHMPIVRHVVAVLGMVATVPYLYWRIFYTVNPAALWFFYLFLFAEGLNILESILFYATTWKASARVVQPPLKDRTVDVFIPTYNESAMLLRDTLVCALAIRYPHRTWVLDDGDRAEIRELADELGCEYLSRRDRSHAKAGNLNAALERTTGEFIVVLDADHVPSPDIVDDLIGLFANPKVAIVQAAQDFYNLDSFQHQTNWKARHAWQQQELFFGVIQPGKDALNAAYYCGSPAMLRRAALDEVGGFATETITEDIHTGLRLQGCGWEVAYINRTLARGLAPQTFVGFITQWSRWGLGAMQVLRAENPVVRRGLSFGQRLCYFASFYFYWMSYQKLIYVATPIFCLLTGIFPLVAVPKTYLLLFTPYLVLNVAASALLQRGFRSFLTSEQFNVLKMPVLMGAMRGLFRSNSEFAVTPKSRAAAARWTDIRLLLVLELAILPAVAVGIWRLSYAPAGYEFWAVVVNLAWAIFYFFLIGPLLVKALRQEEMRISYRFPGLLQLPVRFSYVNPKGTAVSDNAFARNLNRTGLSLTLTAALPVGTMLNLELKLADRHVFATGKVVRQQAIDADGRRRHANGIRFIRITEEDQDAIAKYLFWKVAERHGQMLHVTASSQAEGRSR